MHAHIVLAHPETRSFNGHLVTVAQSTLQEQGWTVSISDLYQKNFDPCERSSHYQTPRDAARFNVQAEQRHACEQLTIPSDVQEEIKLLDAADLLILQYPMWWHMPPAMLKGWFDRVFIYGKVYSSSTRFEHGRFAKKRAMLSVTVGTSRETYAYNGRSGDIELLLWPMNFNLAYAGYTVLKPFIAYGVEAGIQYSDQTVIESRLQTISEQYENQINTINKIKTIPFHTMEDWNDDGQIGETAPAYSAFIRHKKELDLA